MTSTTWTVLEALMCGGCPLTLSSRVTSLHPPGRPCPYQRGFPTLQNSLSAEMSSQPIFHQHNQTPLGACVPYHSGRTVLQWLPVLSNNKLRAVPRPSPLLPPAPVSAMIRQLFQRSSCWDDVIQCLFEDSHSMAGDSSLCM